LSGPETLRWLIEDRGLTQAEVADGAGMSKSTISEILAGKRGLGTAHIRALGAFFRVDPGLFLGPTEEEEDGGDPPARLRRVRRGAGPIEIEPAGPKR